MGYRGCSTSLGKVLGMGVSTVFDLIASLSATRLRGESTGEKSSQQQGVTSGGLPASHCAGLFESRMVCGSPRLEFHRGNVHA